MRLTIAILALLLLAFPVRADSYVQGADGYFYLNGIAHSRTWVPGSTYVNCGRYYSTPGYYSYAPVVVAPVAAVPAFTPNWKSDLIKFLTVREDEQSYIAALKAIGLNPPGYVVQQPSALYGTFGVNSSTIYGYQQQSLAQAVSPFAPSLDQLYLQAFQLADGSQRAANDAIAGHRALANDAALNTAQVAAINARRDAHVAFARLLDGPPVSTSTSTLFKFEGGKVAPVEVLPVPKEKDLGSLSQRWNASAQRCAVCHFGAKLEGGFDVSKFPTLAPAQQLAVVSRLVLPKTDPKFMPKGGEPITGAELSSWVEVMTANRPEALKLPK